MYLVNSRIGVNVQWDLNPLTKSIRLAVSIFTKSL